MKRVLFLIESLSGGGAEKVLSTLVCHLNKNVFDVSVCSIVGGGQYENIVRDYVKYKALLNRPCKRISVQNLLYHIKYHLIYDWLPLQLVYSLFIPKKNDVEIAFIEGFSTKLLAHSSNICAKKIAWVHTDFRNHHWTKSLYLNDSEEECVYNSYNQIVAVARTVEGAIKDYFCLQPPIITLYNPIDDIIIKHLADVAPRFPKNSFRLVSAGRLTSVKAFDRLIRIMERLREDGFIVELWLLGSGEEHSFLESLIHEKNLQDSVTLFGFQANPYGYYAQSDLFVCSSLSEGYSTAVTEALVLGLPIVTTNCSGMTELLGGGSCGLITENNEDALFEGIKRVLLNKDLYAYFKRNAELWNKNSLLETRVNSIERLLLS